MADERPVRIAQGENVWRLWRTDRDGVSREEAIETVGPYLKWALEPGNTGDSPWEFFQTGPGEWRIGAARPIKLVDATQDRRLKLPEGALMGDRQSSALPTLPTVRGQTPWSIVVRFYWRAPSVDIPWPSLKVSDWGFRSRDHTNADWTLDRAIARPDKDLASDDQTWAADQGERAEQVASEAAKALGSGAKTALAVVAVIGTIGVVTYAAVKAN